MAKKNGGVVKGWYPGMRVRVLHNPHRARRPNSGLLLEPGDVIEVDHVFLRRGNYWVSYACGGGWFGEIQATDCVPLEPIPPDPTRPKRKEPNWTVTIAGPERHDGESPFTWLVRARTKDEAVQKAMQIHRGSQETEDVELVEVRRGVPGRNCGYHYNDMREE